MWRGEIKDDRKVTKGISMRDGGWRQELELGFFNVAGERGEEESGTM